MELDESRAPLSAERVESALAAAYWTGPLPVLLTSTTTTADFAQQLLADGAPALSSIVAEEVSDADLGPQSPSTLPAGSALWMSVVVPGREPERDTAWLVNLASLAVVEALRGAAKAPAEIAWPDGITVPGAACGGGTAGTRRTGAVRVDEHPDGYVVSLVINVALGLLELPAGATSVYADGGRIDRAEILAALLPRLEARIDDWRSGSLAARRDYLGRCQTLGRLVRVEGTTGRVVTVDERGDLVVELEGNAPGEDAITLTLPRAGGVPEPAAL